MCIHGTKRIRYGGEKKRAKTAEQAEQTFDPTKISSLEGMYCLPRGQVESSSVFKVCDRCGFADPCTKSPIRTFIPSVCQHIFPKTVSGPLSLSFLSQIMSEMPLWIHCILGNTEGVREALQCGQNANQRSPFGVSGLMYAASGKHLDIMELLLGQPDIDINSRDDSILVGGTPLHWAISGGDSKLVEMLLKQPNLESLESQDIHGYTPLMLAVCRGSFTSIHLLVDKMLAEHRFLQKSRRESGEKKA